MQDGIDLARRFIIEGDSIPRNRVPGGFVKSGRSGDLIYLLLKPDGHYYWQEGRSDHPHYVYNGTWTYNDNVILFNPYSGIGRRANLPTWAAVYFFNENQLGIVLYEFVDFHIRHSKPGARIASSLYELPQGELEAILEVAPKYDASEDN